MNSQNVRNLIQQMSIQELGLKLYHIGAHTNESKAYTREFINEIILEAAQRILKPRITPSIKNKRKSAKTTFSETDGDVLNRCADYLHSMPTQICHWPDCLCMIPIHPCRKNKEKLCNCCETCQSVCYNSSRK